jgi:hypothetical protein
MSVTYTVMRTMFSADPPAARTTASVLSRASVNWPTKLWSRTSPATVAAV